MLSIVLLASARPQHESATGIHGSLPLDPPPPTFPSSLGCHRAPGGGEPCKHYTNTANCPQHSQAVSSELSFPRWNEDEPPNPRSLPRTETRPSGWSRIYTTHTPEETWG